MNDPRLYVLVGLAAGLLLWLLFVLLVSGFSFKRIGLETRSSFRVLRDPEFAAKVAKLLEPPKPEPPPNPSGAPLRVLALLQREGRLIDFLLEDIQGATDEQIGSGVREIQQKCQKALKEHLVLEPVLPQSEGETVEVKAGFDPSAVRLTGNVTGQPPFKGALQHPGWRVKEIKLAPPPQGQDEFVLQPAEVELP
jgi:hypothetical protein